MKSVSAFAPANISCVFKIHPHQNPRLAGSSGIGFTIDKGVTISVEKTASTEIFFNNKPIDFPTVRMVLKFLTPERLKIEIKTELPLGSGFGLSGASALATGYAVNTLLNLGKSEKDLAIIAHTADAAQKTGLGDVANQFFGGFLVKFVPSYEFVVEHLELVDIPVYCRVFSKLQTNTVLSNNSLMPTINQAADTALVKMEKMLDPKKLMTFEDVINVSEEFANRSGLLQDEKVISVISAIKKQGGRASMIMLGNAVFSNIQFPGSTKYIITQKGAYLL
jgi:pantoate kinase